MVWSWRRIEILEILFEWRKIRIKFTLIPLFLENIGHLASSSQLCKTLKLYAKLAWKKSWLRFPVFSVPLRIDQSSFGSILKSPLLGCKLLKAKGQVFSPFVFSTPGIAFSTIVWATTKCSWLTGPVEEVSVLRSECIPALLTAKLCSPEGLHSCYHIFSGKDNCMLNAF